MLTLTKNQLHKGSLKNKLLNVLTVYVNNMFVGTSQSGELSDDRGHSTGAPRPSDQFNPVSFISINSIFIILKPKW